MFQDFALMPWATVLRNAAFGLELRGVPRKEREATAREYVDKVGLTGFEDAYPHQLSGGCASASASPAPSRWTPTSC